jgi:hypothetical protein
MSGNYSHSQMFETLKGTVEAIVGRVNKEEDTKLVQEKLNILEQLQEFGLGRFLLQHGGLNGYWTDYIVQHPFKPTPELNKIEDFILNKAPSVLATQQRFVIFKEIIQAELEDNNALASVPCGLMGDMLTLDYSNINDFKLTAFDVDEVK